MPSFQEHDIEYDKGAKKIHYIQAGPDNGELIVFMHGWPGIGKTWHNQLTAFAAKGFKVVAPDMPGYGKSSARKISSDYAQENVVHGMLSLLQHLGHKQAIWVAHDWGCGTLWSLVRSHPEVCKAVCSMTIPYATLELGLEELVSLVDRKLYPENEYPWGQWSYMAFYEQSFEQAVAWFDKGIRGFLKAGFTKGNPAALGKPAATANVVKDGGRWGGQAEPPSPDKIPDEASCIDKETFEELVAAIEKNGFWTACSWYSNHEANRAFNLANSKRDAHVKFPVLFIEAKYDTICATADSRLGDPQKELCDDLTFISIEAGHFVPLEKWQEVNEAISKWLDTKVNIK